MASKAKGRRLKKIIDLENLVSLIKDA